VFDWIAFGIIECKTCLLIMYVGYFYWSLFWNLKLYMPEQKREGRNSGGSLRHYIYCRQVDRKAYGSKSCQAVPAHPFVKDNLETGRSGLK
jgi:hypothetical protein